LYSAWLPRRKQPADGQRFILSAVPERFSSTCGG
jgi:hypothetical protein